MEITKAEFKGYGADRKIILTTDRDSKIVVVKRTQQQRKSVPFLDCLGVIAEHQHYFPLSAKEFPGVSDDYLANHVAAGEPAFARDFREMWNNVRGRKNPRFLTLWDRAEESTIAEGQQAIYRALLAKADQHKFPGFHKLNVEPDRISGDLGLRPSDSRALDAVPAEEMNADSEVIRDAAMGHRVGSADCLVEVIGKLCAHGFVLEDELREELKHRSSEEIRDACDQLERINPLALSMIDDELGVSGAEPNRLFATPTLFRSSTRLADRVKKKPAAKRAVARRMYELLGETEPPNPVWPGAGGTTFLLAYDIARRGIESLLVVTNSLLVGTLLKDIDDFCLVHGEVDKSNLIIRASTAGLMGIPEQPRVAIMGVDSLDPASGCTCSDLGLTFQRVACERLLPNGTVFLLTDAEEIRCGTGELFLAFEDLDSMNKRFHVLCGVRGVSDALREEAEEAKVKLKEFDNGEAELVE